MRNTGKRKYAVFQRNAFGHITCIARLQYAHDAKALILKAKIMYPENEYICPKLGICGDEKNNLYQNLYSGLSINTTSRYTNSNQFWVLHDEISGNISNYSTGTEPSTWLDTNATETDQKCRVSDLVTTLMHRTPGVEQEQNSKESIVVEKRGAKLPRPRKEFWNK